MNQTQGSATDYEGFLRDEEFIARCKRRYNRIEREDNLEYLLAKA